MLMFTVGLSVSCVCLSCSDVCSDMLAMYML